MDRKDDATLLDILERRAQDRADELLYLGLPDRSRGSVSQLTYGELFQRSTALAAILQDLTRAGSRALLVYSAGLEFVVASFACLLANVVAVPTYPPRPRASLKRLRRVLSDSGAQVILGESSSLRRLQGRDDFDPGQLILIATDSIDCSASAIWQRPEISPDDPAFLQYTSGSTRGLKAVVLRHRNIMSHSAMIRDAFGHTEASRGVICLPPYHDMGLVGGILQPLFVGFPVALLSPFAMMQRPLRWLQAITEFRATTSGGPDFFYRLCIERISPEERQGLDLSSWRVAFNGSEMVKPRTVREFTAAFGRCGFRPEAFFPCYGMAEATLMITGCRLNRAPVIRSFSRSELARGRALPSVKAGIEGTVEAEAAVELVSCGQAPPTTELWIVDPTTRRRLGDGEVGEIWFQSGDSLPSSYWRSVEKSRQTFGACLADGSGPYLATGDQGFILDGELYLLGRQDDLLIIRGRNYYCQDLETSVQESHPTFSRGATTVFDAGDGGSPRLVVAQELGRRGWNRGADALRAQIRQAITAEHGLRVDEVLLVRPTTIPRTANGKVRRSACRQAYRAGTLIDLAHSSILREGTSA
ncbi:MAG: fatty acyl-AMP ligase [Acidobacteriota bacterium]